MRNLFARRRLLTGLGVLCLALSAGLAVSSWWDLYGTGIVEERAQRNLEEQFSASLAAPTTTSSLPPVQTTTMTPAPPSTTHPYLEDGSPVARLEIPTINLKQIVVMGTTDEVLKKGPGMFRTAEWPGQVGNTTIAGHRTSHGAPFRHIDELNPGDVVTLTTNDGVFKYSVTETFIVQGSDNSPLRDTTGEQVLTLVSCHPLHSTAKRIIVRAELLPLS